MSRVGKDPISLPDGVQVEVGGESVGVERFAQAYGTGLIGPVGHQRRENQAMPHVRRETPNPTSQRYASDEGGVAKMNTNEITAKSVVFSVALRCVA